MPNRTTTNDEWLTVSEAAEILKVHHRTVQRYIAEGTLPATRTPGGRDWRIRRSDVAPSKATS